MEFIRKTSATVHTVSGNHVGFYLEGGETFSLSRVPHQVVGLLLAAGELDVEIHIRPKKGIALSGRVSGDGDTLVFPTLYISDSEVRVNSQKIAITTPATVSESDAQDTAPESTPADIVINDVDTEWRIKRDEAIAEGIIAEFYSNFGTNGPNDAFVSAYRLMVGDIIPAVSTVNVPVADAAPSDAATADSSQGTSAEDTSVAVIGNHTAEAAPTTDTAAAEAEEPQAEVAQPLATFDPKGTATPADATAATTSSSTDESATNTPVTDASATTESGSTTSEATASTTDAAPAAGSDDASSSAAETTSAPAADADQATSDTTQAVAPAVDHAEAPVAATTETTADDATAPAAASDDSSAAPAETASDSTATVVTADSVDVAPTTATTADTTPAADTSTTAAAPVVDTTTTATPAAPTPAAS